MAVSLTALLGATGSPWTWASDCHRREVQNAADSAAVAGAMALGRHIVYTYDGSSVAGVTLTDYTDDMIQREIQSAAASTVPPFPGAATAPSWPTGGASSLTAYYMVSETTQGPQVGSVGGAPPPNAVGIRVVPRLEVPYPVRQGAGSLLRDITVGASARAMLRPLASYQAPRSSCAAAARRTARS